MKTNSEESLRKNNYPVGRMLAKCAIASLLVFVDTALAEDGLMKFDNRSDVKVRVKILHSNGKLHKDTNLTPKESNTFRFESNFQNGCADKNRQFVILRKSDGVQLSSGTI